MTDISHQNWCTSGFFEASTEHPQKVLMWNPAAKTSIFNRESHNLLSEISKSTCVFEGPSGNSSVILPRSLPNARDEHVGGKSGISECCGKQRTLERNSYDLIHNKSSRVSRRLMIYTIKGIICPIPEPFTLWRMMIKKHLLTSLLLQFFLHPSQIHLYSLI